jgi:hypothetical protein
MIIHALGGLGAVCLGWWLIDGDLKYSQEKREWNSVCSSLVSDIRRNLWLSRELQAYPDVIRESGTYARYWSEGMKRLHLKLSRKKEFSHLDIWPMLHVVDIDNQMLDCKRYNNAIDNAAEVERLMLALVDLMERISPERIVSKQQIEQLVSGTPSRHTPDKPPSNTYLSN